MHSGALSSFFPASKVGSVSLRVCICWAIISFWRPSVSLKSSLSLEKSSHCCLRLSRDRFGLSYDRFGLSCERFGLFCDRFGLRCIRVDLSCNNFGLSCDRFGLNCDRVTWRRISVNSIETCVDVGTGGTGAGWEFICGAGGWLSSPGGAIHQPACPEYWRALLSCC